MELYLIRHAQSQNNALPEHLRVEDPGLTETGREQARHLAAWLPSLNLTKLLTSPFLRALQTTESIVQATRLIPEVRLELHEQGGCYRGHTSENIIGRPGLNRSEIERAFPGYQIAPTIDGQGWWASKPYEHREAAKVRAAHLLQGTLDEFADSRERVACVMHADLILLLLEHLEFVAIQRPRNASVTTLQISPKRCRISEFDGIQHLPEGLITR